MNSREAREILILFRPGTADDEDPVFAEARRLAAADPELARWFAEHCAGHLALRQKFHDIPVPRGLQEQILSERKISRPFLQRYWAPLLAAAAAVALLASLEMSPLKSSDPVSASYKVRMVGTALRATYAMDLETNDIAGVLAYLKRKNAPADLKLPAGLERAGVAGCAVTHWQSSPVSMICFKSGRPLQPGDKSDLWLFVANRAVVADAPVPEAPAYGRVNKATTVTWTEGDKTYLLASVSDEAFLRKYLQ